MSYGSHGRLTRQTNSIRTRLRSNRAMPFADILGPEAVQDAIATHGPRIRHCVFTPLRVIYAFLAQVMNPDPSCRQATTLILLWQGLCGHNRGSIDTGPYCKARRKLPEALPANLARKVGADLHRRFGKDQLLRGRPVKIVDGSTCSMPDTPENQAQYPQAHTQKAGLGFPVMRFVVVLSLACGVALNAAMGPYHGKGTGETALLRKLEDEFAVGDIVLGDRYFCSYWQIAAFHKRRVDCIFRMHQLRHIDFRKGRCFGYWDHVVKWQRPIASNRPEWLDQDDYHAMPGELEIREVKRRVHIKGFRVRVLVLATTLLDAQQYPAEELMRAFRARWHAEVDLRSIKVAMKMDVLRCKTPEMVRKEFWMHLLAYNLVRTIMAEAAGRGDRLPRDISLTATLQLLRSFAPLVALLPGPIATQMHALLLEALSKEVVGDRPNRYEPRAIKRRPKPHRLLNEPRHKAQRRMERNAK